MKEKIEILDICPDCGGILFGNFCKECNTFWKFRKPTQKINKSKVKRRKTTSKRIKR